MASMILSQTHLRTVSSFWKLGRVGTRSRSNVTRRGDRDDDNQFRHGKVIFGSLTLLALLSDERPHLLIACAMRSVRDVSALCSQSLDGKSGPEHSLGPLPSF